MRFPLVHKPVIHYTSITIALLLMTGVFAAEPLVWHPTFEAAKTACQQSTKPLLVVVYEPENAACINMSEHLFKHPDVIVQLRNFELYAASIKDPATLNLQTAYKVGVHSPTAEGTITNAVLPVLLFLDYNGYEYFRDYGNVLMGTELKIKLDISDKAASMLAIRLQKILQLITAIRRTAATPDAEANATAGHLMIELERFEKAPPYLDKAMSLDTRNERGAFANAYLDTIILKIVDDPALCLQQLEGFETSFNNSDRLLEVRYFKAVCWLAQDQFKEARKLLETFETGDKSKPEFASPWTPKALGLLEQLRKLDLGR